MLNGAATAGTAGIRLSIPWMTSLSGAVLFLQGGALDGSGALLGVASLTPGMQIVIGD